MRDGTRKTTAARHVRGDDGRPNTVGLGLAALIPMLDGLDSSDAAGSRRRRFVRWPFRRESLELRITHPGGTQVAIRVACRNLSAEGLSVLHSTFLHPGSVCTVVLPNPRRGPQELRGTIVRCQHRSGMIHEIGIRLEEMLSVREYVPNHLFSDWFAHERVDPARLEASIVGVSLSVLDQRIIKHFLRDSLVRIRWADGLRSVGEVVAQGTGLILCNTDLPDIEPIETVAAVRAAAETTPVVLVAPDSSPLTQERVCKADPDAVLVRPLSQQMLLRAIAEFVLADPRRARTGPQATADFQALREMLRTHMAQLTAGLRQRDADVLFGACFQIRDVAEKAAMKQLARLAEEAMRALSTPGLTEVPIRTLQALALACEGPEARGERDGTRRDQGRL